MREIKINGNALLKGNGTRYEDTSISMRHNANETNVWAHAEEGTVNREPRPR